MCSSDLVDLYTAIAYCNPQFSILFVEKEGVIITSAGSIHSSDCGIVFIYVLLADELLEILNMEVHHNQKMML